MSITFSSGDTTVRTGKAGLSLGLCLLQQLFVEEMRPSVVHLNQLNESESESIVLEESLTLL